MRGQRERHSKEAARLALATSAGGIGIWEWHLSDNSFHYSEIAKAICGFTADKPVTWEDVTGSVHPEDYPRTSAMAKRALDPNVRERVPYEYRLIRPNGEIVWVLAHGEAVFEKSDGNEVATLYIGTIQDITNRKRLEAENTASRARLALAIQAGRMAVWEYDFASDEVSRSAELNRILGFPDDATPSASEMRARYFPGERDRIDRLGAEALARGERFLEVEYRYLWPDGSIRWLLLRAEGQFDASGKLYRAVGVIMDITDRRQAETNLIESQKRLELAQTISGIGVWDWYPRTSEIVWSPAMYELLGIDRSTQPSQLYQAWSDGLLEDDREAASAAPRLAADEGKAFSIEFRVQLRGGAVRWVRSSGSPVIEGDPPYRVIGVSIDVTAEKEREQELKAIAQDLKAAVDLSERQKARIFELSTDLLGLVGPDGNLESFNEVWVRKLGLSAAEIATTPFVDLLTPDGRASAQAALVSREASPPRQFETRMQTRRQHDLVVIWTVMSDEKLTYLLGRDVTREREQEEALLQTQKMEAVGQLTGGISHDFNNLLHAVRASFDLILRRPGDGEKVRRFAEAGREAAERGSKLTAQLLAFSRSQTLALTAVPVDQVLMNMHDLIVRTIDHGTEVRMDPAAAGVHVLADVTQLEMAILNLAINARDAMGEGGALTIATRSRILSGRADVSDGRYVEISLTDQGSGMPRETARRAFEPFFTTKPIGKGTGLGLSQVYSMATRAGGTARIKSAEGKGTKVSIFLPVVEAGEQQQARRAEENGPSGSGLVLVVDDDVHVRQFAAAALQELGYEILEAQDGPSALLLLERYQPLVVLMDYAMPGMSGADAAERIRALQPGLPILFMTGHADMAAIERVARTQIHVLRKPFGISTLAEAMRAILRTRGAASQSTRGTRH